jgi:hypothetical protein
VLGMRHAAQARGLTKEDTMTARKLDKKEWQAFLDRVSMLLEGVQAEILDLSSLLRQRHYSPLRHCQEIR